MHRTPNLPGGTAHNRQVTRRAAGHPIQSADLWEVTSMASNQFGPGRTATERSAAEVQAGQDAARAADTQRQRAAGAAGPDRRSIGTTR
jgi:hypothetical protein